MARLATSRCFPISAVITMFLCTLLGIFELSTGEESPVDKKQVSHKEEYNNHHILIKL